MRVKELIDTLQHMIETGELDPNADVRVGECFYGMEGWVSHRQDHQIALICASPHYDEEDDEEEDED